MKILKWLFYGALMLAGGVAAQAAPTALAPTALAPTALAPSPLAPSARPPAVTAAAAPAPGTAGHPLTGSDVDAWLDGYMPYALHTGDIPGAVVVVVKDGKLLTARGFGYADLGKRTPVDPARTLFRPGSVSKLVTWTAVMQLVEAHKLDLDADVNTYLDFKIPPRDGKPVTLRQIMTHTAGFEDSAKGIIFFDAKQKLVLGDYLKRWTPARIYAPGSTPAYSNWATALAGYLVERASGESFDDYVDHHIFAPLGMVHASFRQPLPPQLAGLMATGYPKPGKPSPGFEFIGPFPAGSLSASGVDMGRFMLAHLNGGTLDGQRILSAETAAMMHDSPLDRVDPMSLIPPLNRMELGFFETNVNGHEVIGHLGDTEAFHTSLHLFLADGIGFYVSFNSPGKAGAVGTLRGQVFQDFADRYLPAAAAPDSRVDAKTAAGHVQMIAGTWENSRHNASSFLTLVGLVGQTKVAAGADGELVVPSLLGPNGRPREWVETAPFVWRDRFGHDRLAAKVVDGKVVRWSMDELSPFMVFDRVPAATSGVWLMPALYASLAVLVLTALLWPASWFSRRYHKLPAEAGSRPTRVTRAARVFEALDLVLLVAWGGIVATMLGDLRNTAGGLDPLLWLLQIAGIIVFFGAVVLSGWDMWLTWTTGRRWLRKLWSLLIFLGTLVVLYTAVQFNLVALSVHY